MNTCGNRVLSFDRVYDTTYPAKPWNGSGASTWRSLVKTVAENELTEKRSKA